MFYIIMGVSGSGKSTIGKLLSDRLNCQFYDGDDFHPPSNLQKMNNDIPLTDSDRQAWLEKLQALITSVLDIEEEGVLACSALKSKYRQILSNDNPKVVFIYLQGDYDCLKSRIQSRQGHFMGVDLLRSQFETLEEPKDAVIVNVCLEPRAIVAEILNKIT